METPNTRSRRKRGLDTALAQEEVCVTWMHDNQLRQELLLADGPGDKSIDPPTPTQRPRSIANLSSAGPTSHAQPRKRPCRTGRSSSSLPAGLGSANSNSKSAGGPEPSKSTQDDDSGRRLDQLLDQVHRIMVVGSRPERSRSITSLSATTSTSTTLTSGSSSISTPRTGNSAAEEKGQGSERRSSARWGQELSLTKHTLSSPRLREQRNNGPIPAAEVFTPARKRSPLKQTITALRSHNETPSKPAAVTTRRDSNSNSKLHRGITVTTTPKTKVASSPRTFKPPHLSTPGVRSSPRRTATAVNSAGSVRGAVPLPINALPTRNSCPATSFRTAPHVVHHSVPAPEKVLPAHPSSDDDGNISFDSIDGLFELGGPEIEQILAAVDGGSR